MSDYQLAVRKLAACEPNVLLNIIAEGLDIQEILSYLRDIAPLNGCESAARAVLYARLAKSPQIIDNFLTKLETDK